MKKSTRNGPLCRKSPLSAGDNAANSCPPALKASVKRALKKEIENFDAQQARIDAEESAAGKSAVNAYSEWLEVNGGNEPMEANPDVLSEDDGINFLSKMDDDNTASLLEEARFTFSDKEHQCWNLVMIKNMTYQDTGDLLHLSKSTVKSYVERAKKKFTTYLQGVKNAGQD